MKIKRFVARNMRQALQEVRKEQGPDAVILSNRRVEGGIEVVAAVDYDATLIGPSLAPEKKSLIEEAPLRPQVAPRSAVTPARPREPVTADPVVSATPAPRPEAAQSRREDPGLSAMRDEMQHLRGLLEDQLSSLAWNDEARRDPATANVLRRFAEIGIDADVARAVASGSTGDYDATVTAARATELLAAAIREVDDGVLDRGGVVAVVGPTGVGKTTSIAKLAARFALRHGRDQVALVSTDSFRIGAQEQLATFAQLLDVPVHMVADNDDIGNVLGALSDKKLVLIDTAGMSQRDDNLSRHLDAFRCDSTKIRTYLALAANGQSETLDEVVREFGRVPLDGCILTKIDEAGSLGGALSAVIRHKLPLAWLADGQRVPEDLHSAVGKVGWTLDIARRLCESRGTIREEHMARQYGEVRANAYA